MNKLLILAVLLISSMHLTAQTGVHMTFEKELINLGEVKKGAKVSDSFTFVNTGSEIIEIDIVSGCECTTLDWTMDPIAPGESGVVDFIFDSTTKDASENIEIDINLINTDPKTGGPILKIVSYEYTLIK